MRSEIDSTEKQEAECVPMEENEQQDYLTGLNDDCILAIFERLALGELCEVAGTCERLRDLAENQFVRKYASLIENSTLNIIVKKGVIRLDENKRFVEAFSRKIPNVMVNADDDDELTENHLRFMQSKCGKSIENIHFRGVYFSASFRDGIKEHLQVVDAVQLTANHSFRLCPQTYGPTNDRRLNKRVSMCEPTNDLGLDKFLNDLPTLKILTIDGCEKPFKKVNWPNVKCPKLETFKCEINFDVQTLDSMRHFFDANRAIAYLKFHAFFSTTEPTKEMLKIIARYSNIEVLHIKIFSGFDIAMIRNELKMLDAREDFKRLIVNTFSGEVTNLAELASLNSFHEFRVTGCARSFKQQLPAYGSWANLKTWVISGDHLNDADAVHLATSMKSLEKLILSGTTTFIQRLVKAFARHASKLMEIKINGFIDDKTFDSSALNEARKQLYEATKLIIYVRGWQTETHGDNKKLVELRNYIE